MQINDTIHTLNKTIKKFEHIAGHQEEEENFENLTRMSQFNIFYDQIATSKLKQLEISRFVPFLPASQISFSINLTQITHHIPTQIRKQWSKQKKMEYLTRHHNWLPIQHKSVDWSIFYNTLRSLAKKKQSWMIR